MSLPVFQKVNLVKLEGLDLLLNHLLDYFPQYYQQQSATIKNLCTGTTFASC